MGAVPPDPRLQHRGLRPPVIPLAYSTGDSVPRNPPGLRHRGLCPPLTPPTALRGLRPPLTPPTALRGCVTWAIMFFGGRSGEKRE